jgi:hypothetical protein
LRLFVGCDYQYNYHYGRDLLSRHVAIGDRAAGDRTAGDRIAHFQTLLEQPLAPSRVEQRIAQSNKGGQVG